MASILINKSVSFKSSGTVKVYTSASTSSKSSTEVVDNITKYTATKSSGIFYYIKEFRGWVHNSLVEGTSDLQTVSANSIRYRFSNLNKSVYTYVSSISSKASGVYTPEDRLYTVTNVSNGRSYISEIGAWVSSNTIQVANSTYSEQTAKQKVEAEKKKQEQTNALNKIKQDLVESSGSTTTTGGSDSATRDLDILDTVGVWGIPYQHSSYVDPKLSGTKFGSYYADRVISRMPLLVLSPGKVAFMKNSSAQDTDTVKDLLSAAGDSSDSPLSTYLRSPGKYYTFEYDNSTYWEYVNTMNRASAIYLGIGDVKVTYNGYTKKLEDFKWEKACNNVFKSALQATDTFISFFADSEQSASESFSNSTSESMIAGTLNKSSELGREIRFLIGEDGKLGSIIDNDAIDSALQAIDNLTNVVLEEGNIVSQMSKEFAIIASGGKLIFPELWSDSTYTSDFDVKIKLRCPCPNKVSYFLDIIVPLNCLKALTMPRTPHGQDIAGELLNDDVTSNGYFSPFLVRGFYKGIATVDLGIVTSLSISKGKEGSWTVDGLPTEVDVDLSIKDLYNTMAMSNESNGTTQLLNNTQFLSYLAFNCGISVNQPDIIKSAMLWGAVATNSFVNSLKEKVFLYKYWRDLSNAASNKMTDIVSGIFR